MLWLFTLPIAVAMALWAGLLASLARPLSQPSPWVLTLLVLASLLTLALGSCYSLLLAAR